MGTHPNVILMAVLTPKGLARQTMKNILGTDEIGEDDAPEVEIDGVKYHPLVMENDYNEGWQIAAKEGDLVFHDMVTYGYGEVIAWEKLEALKAKLEAWAKDTAEKHQCDYRIDVTANYW